MAKIDFDASAADPNAASFDPIPQDHYLATCIKSEEKVAKSGDGMYYELEFEIVDGQYKGRRVWDRINHKHKNRTAENLGRSKLSQLCVATGVSSPRDTIELHNIPIVIDVRLVERQDKPGEMSNEIKRYYHRNQDPRRQQQPAAAAATSAPASASSSDGGKAPWDR